MVAILMIFLLQQLVLYYTVYFVRNEKRILYILALDIIIGKYLDAYLCVYSAALYLLSGTISTKGLSSACISVQWCLCCTSTVIKLIAILFSPNNADVTVTSEFDRLATGLFYALSPLYRPCAIQEVKLQSLINSDAGGTASHCNVIALVFANSCKNPNLHENEMELHVYSLRIFGYQL